MSEMAINSLDVTVSGCPCDFIYDPNGDMRHIIHGKTILQWFEPYKVTSTFALNLVEIEIFQQRTYPLVEIWYDDVFKGKSWFYKFWWNGWKEQYTLNYKITGYKNVTMIKMRSEKVYYIDESKECIENALDACVWNSDFI